MSLWLERFIDVELPLIEAEQDIGAVGTRTQYFDLPGGGAHDAYGDEVAPRGMYRLQATGEIGNLTTQAEMQVQFDALRAKRGRRGKLYARMDDGTVRWVWARLPNIPMRRGVDNVLYLLASLSFDVTSPVWYGDRHGGGWTFDSGESFDTGLVFDEDDGDVWTLDHTDTTAFLLYNAGNADITNTVVTFTPGSAAITAFTLRTLIDLAPRSDLIYSGTVAVGQVLVLDTGAHAAYIPTEVDSIAIAAATTIDVISSAGYVIGRTVEIVLDSGKLHRTTIATLPDAVSFTIADPLPSSASPGQAVRMDAYDDLDFGDTHSITEWLRIEPPSISVLIDITSTQDASVSFTYSDGYE